MNPLLLLLIAAGVIYGAGYASTGTGLQDLDIMPSGIKYVKQSGFWKNLTTQKFKLDISIKNPNSKNIEFQKFIGNVLMSGNVIADINIEKKLPILPKDTTILKGIVFEVDTFSLGSNVWSLLSENKKLGTEFVIDGHIVADGFKYPINEPISL